MKIISFLFAFLLTGCSILNLPVATPAPTPVNTSIQCFDGERQKCISPDETLTLIAVENGKTVMTLRNRGIPQGETYPEMEPSITGPEPAWPGTIISYHGVKWYQFKDGKILVRWDSTQWHKQ